MKSQLKFSQVLIAIGTVFMALALLLMPRLYQSVMHRAIQPRHLTSLTLVTTRHRAAMLRSPRAAVANSRFR